MFRSSVLACVMAGVLALSACGGGQSEPKAPTPTPAGGPSETPAPSSSSSAASAGAPASGPSKPWKEMTQGEKKDHMKTVVTPKMATVFQSFNAKEFSQVTCVTCHGPGAKSGKFVMPSPDLPKLSPADSFKKHMTAKPEMTKFMMQKVVPEMASALGVAPYNPETHQGFGCGGCHMIEK